MSETIFSKIIRREIPATIVYETENVLAFKDINPKAPVHILVIPKKFIQKVSSAAPEDKEVLGELLLAAGEISRKEGFEEQGFRVVINNGRDGGQEVPHLHLHILAGRKLTWPPG